MKNGVVMSMVAFGIGSAIMYYWDPTNGRRRRAHARQITKRTVRQAQKVADTTARNLGHVKDMEWGDVAKLLVPVTAKALLWR
jgi:hypothetical protein